MNYLSVEELAENLVILFEEYDTSGGNEAIQFPTEDEIYNQILGTEPALTSTPTEDLEFKPNEPIAVLWNKDDGTRYWCISFLCTKMMMTPLKLIILCNRNTRQVETGFVEKVMMFSWSVMCR